MNKTLYITIIAFCIAVSSSFYVGKQAGYQQCLNEQITQPSNHEASTSFLEWQILDEQRRNDAFREVVLIYQEEMKRRGK